MKITQPQSTRVYTLLVLYKNQVEANIFNSFHRLFLLNKIEEMKSYFEI